jgi:hypothetical protein
MKPLKLQLTTNESTLLNLYTALVRKRCPLSLPCNENSLLFFYLFFSLSLQLFHSLCISSLSVCYSADALSPACCSFLLPKNSHCTACIETGVFRIIVLKLFSTNFEQRKKITLIVKNVRYAITN